MKTIKRIVVAMSLAFALIVSAVPTVVKADPTDYEVTAPGSVGTDIVLSVDETFTVKIPKTISLDTNNKANDYLTNYQIYVKGDIAAANQIKVSLDSANFVLTQDGKPDGAGVIDIDGQSGLEKTWVHTDINPNDYLGTDEDGDGIGDGGGEAETRGNVTATGVTAGEYSGTVTFNIVLEAIPVQPPVGP